MLPFPGSAGPGCVGTVSVGRSKPPTASSSARSVARRIHALRGTSPRTASTRASRSAEQRNSNLTSACATTPPSTVGTASRCGGKPRRARRASPSAETSSPSRSCTHYTPRSGSPTRRTRRARRGPRCDPQPRQGDRSTRMGHARRSRGTRFWRRGVSDPLDSLYVQVYGPDRTKRLGVSSRDRPE